MSADAPPAWAAVVTDVRLSREARILVLYVMSLGEGEHRVSHHDFRCVLGRTHQGLPKDETIAGFVFEATTYGYLERRPGGSGPPAYAIQTPLPGGGLAPPPRGGSESRPPSQGVPWNVQTPLPGGGLGDPSSSLLLPPPPLTTAREEPDNLSWEATAAIEGSGDLLTGCRGALRDYLRARVDPAHQHGYVQRLVMAMNGSDVRMWQDATGRTLADGRPAILAMALNELLAGDEVGKHFPRRPGAFENLRSKVRYLVASELGAQRDATRPPPETTHADRSGSAGTTRPPSGRRPVSPAVHVET